MTTTYPSHPNLDGNYAPLRMECDLNDLIVEGEIPKDLFGSYYRNGPDPQFPGVEWIPFTRRSFLGKGSVSSMPSKIVQNRKFGADLGPVACVM